MAWFGMNPVMNLGPFYDLAGRSQSLNQAYGIQNKAELIRDVCPRVNPVDLAADLTWLPLRTWQGRDDQVTPPRDLERFDAADPGGRRLAFDHVWTRRPCDAGWAARPV